MSGFTQFDNALLEKVLTSDLTKRQLKILLLVLRFSSGYQKGYAILRKNDFAYAGVSPYCIKEELKKLSRKRVIFWNPEKDILWINPNVHEWAVDRVGEKSGDNMGRFFKIATKNSPKQQMAIYRNSKVFEGDIYTKKSKKKEELLLKTIRNYFLKVAPLTESEMFILKQVVDSYPPRTIHQAIEALSAESDRSFPHFMKTLDGFVAQARRSGRLGSMKSNLERIRKSLREP